MDQDTVNEIRGYYGLPDSVTDEQIKNELKGSLGEAVVNLARAKKDLFDAIYKSLPNWLKSRIER